MPGAWEIPVHGSVLCGILHTETTSMAWALGFRNLQIPGPIMPVAGMPFDQARNTICMKAMEIGVDYCFMLDSDVIPPNDAVLRLMKHGLPIVSGVYARRSPPHSIPVMLRGGNWIQPDQLPKDGKLFEVDVCGAGCLLIRRDVLEKMPPQRPEAGAHWFDWRVQMQSIRPQHECLSEDFTFCVAAKKCGFPTAVDPSVVCRHVGFAQALPGIFVPADTTPNT